MASDDRVSASGDTVTPKRLWLCSPGTDRVRDVYNDVSADRARNSGERVTGPWVLEAWVLEDVLASVVADRDGWKARCIDGAQDAARRLEQARLDAGRVAADRDDKDGALRYIIDHGENATDDPEQVAAMVRAARAALSGTAPAPKGGDDA